MSSSVWDVSILLIMTYSFLIRNHVSCLCNSSGCPSELITNFSNQYQKESISICTDDIQPCEVPSITPECSDAEIPVGNHGFEIQSLKILNSEKGNFLQILWKVPTLASRNGLGPPEPVLPHSNTTWTLKLTVDNSSCITLTFTPEILHQNKSNFLLPCVKISDGVQHILQYTLFVQHETTRQQLHSQELKIISSKGLTIILSPSAYNFEIIATNKLLEFTFLTKHHFGYSYNVSVHNVGNGKCDLSASVDSWSASKMWKFTLRSSLDKYESCKTYCFQVIPIPHSSVCNGSCTVNLTDMVYFYSPALLKNCSSWNGSLTALDYSIEKEMKISFHKCCGYEHCFRHFQLRLVRLHKNNCNKFYSVAESPIRNIYPDNYIWNVKNLSAAKYCAKVKPYSCMECNVLNSKIATIRSIRDNQKNSLPTNAVATEQNAIITSSIIASLFVFGMLISGFVYWQKTKRPFIPLKIEQVKDPVALSSLQMQVPNITTFVLHTFDHPVKEKVLALVNNCRQNTNVTVELCTEHRHSLETEKAEEWIFPRLQFGTTNKSDPNKRKVRKVVVVESARAVAYESYQHMLNSEDAREFDDPSQNMEGIDLQDRPLERLFCYALKVISSKEQEALNDYFHLLVVHFTDITPRDCRFERLVPHLRYDLPEDTEAFYAFLKKDTDDSDFTVPTVFGPAAQDLLSTVV